MRSSLLVALLLALPLVLAADAPPLAPRSPGAVAAIRKADVAIKAAEVTARQAKLAAKRDLVTALQSAKKEALLAQNLAEGNAIESLIVQTQAEIDLANGKAFAVQARDAWQPTAHVEAGQVVKITAKGRWNAGRGERYVNITANGVPAAGKQPAVGYLEARIDEGEPFMVGAEAQITANESGVLSFRIHDPGGDSDNSGSLQVTIMPE